MSWAKIRLGDVISTLKGFAFKRSHYVDVGYPIVRASNFTLDSISDDDLKYYSNKEAEQYKKYALQHNDILIQTVGSWEYNPNSVVGKVVCVPQKLEGALLNQNIVKIIPNENVDNRFLYYRLKCTDFTKYTIGNAVGAANQASITLDTIKDFVFTMPNLRIQKKFAEILSTYDDLIENNQKQIKLLEEAAQRLYKEWFVDFRFPGYENTPFVDGVPEGWSTRKLETFGDIITGKTPSTANESYYNGNIPFVKIPDMHNTIYPIITESTLSEEGANTQKNKFIPKNSIMVSCIATVGLVNIAVEECQTNQQINSIVLNDLLDLYYLYFSTKRLKMLLDGVGSNGATMTNVNKGKFANIEILYPTVELRDQFYDSCQTIFEKILVLSKSIIELKNSRDQLLPKLMSGELEV